MNQDTIDRLANDLELAKHEPYSKSYNAFCIEVLAQYDQMLDRGIVIQWTKGTITGTSRDLFELLDKDKALIVATDGSGFMPHHPLAKHWYRNTTLNSMFRAVHDYYGHYLTRSPFETLAGELEAYKAHSLMFSERAQDALFSETVAQLAYHYSRNEFVPVQKCAILNRSEYAL